MYFFTADEHLGHVNIIKYNNRPFKDVDEMDAQLIANFNSIVSKNDTTIHVGDFCWLNKKKDVYNTYVNKLNGNHVLLRGSHDHWLPDSAHSVWSKTIEGIHVVACHYAFRVWPRSHYGSWNLHGHSHGRLAPQGKQLDVGVDCHNYHPVSWDEVKKIMETREDNFNLIRDRYE